MAKNTSGRSTRKRVAMVAPVPSKPAPTQTKMAGTDFELAAILQQLKNDRSYTILDEGPNSWLVLFEGDLKPSYVMQVEGKWKIVQAK